MTATSPRTLLPALTLALLVSGCTAWDRFKLDQPAGAVELVGGLNVASAPGGGDSCAPGTAVYWGVMRNTGDLDVEDVRAVVDVFGANGALLGAFSDNVFSGEVTEGEGGTASTSLAVDQSGSFTICTSVPFGLAARAEIRSTFSIVEPEGEHVRP